MSLKSLKMSRFAASAVALFILLLTAAGTGLAATASEFYLSLLRRGIGNYDAGRFEAAARELDLAAFGLIESVDHFETAKVYAALANDKLGRAAQARTAAQRVLAAERVQRRFAQISLPAEVRSSFIALAKKLLTAPEAAAFTSNAPVPPPRVTTPPATSSTRPPATTTPPRTTTTNPQPQPQIEQPQPQVQPPATTTTPVVPTPQKTEPAPPKVEPPKVEPPKPEPPKPQVVEPPKVVEQKTVPFPPEPAPQQQPKVEPPKVEPPKPQTSQAPPTSRPAPTDLASRLAAAERHLAANNLLDARVVYRELIETNLDRANLLAVAEGSYRARDFATTVRALDRVGTLNKGEEPYRYYLAVALYETGQYRRAKRELAAALPFIEINESVARYRAKIEGAID